ncbi:MAG: FAD-binding oxidoreductase [Nanoarchaeota archaeon]
MLYENWLYTGSLNIKTPYCAMLQDAIKTQCLVIGGGFAGLHAALKLVDTGKKVVLLEKRFCGGSSSGQSGGFLTPESEEDLRQIIAHHGKEKAKIIYNIPTNGVDLIVNTIKKYTFNCDLRKQSSFYFSTKSAHVKRIQEEAESKKEGNFPHKLYNKNTIKKIHPGKKYLVGLKYPGSYGINSFAYCQEMKNLLLKKGVKIYEDSEVHAIEGNTAKTHLGSVQAENIIICVDKLKTEINEELSHNYYHLQTYLAISEPLSKQEMKSLFPQEELMCWDTELEYIHYRPVLGNRLIVGGSSPWTAYLPKIYHSPKIITAFINKLRLNFPVIKDVEFTQYWSGMIDVTKDLMPIADYDSKNKSIQYSMGCAGLNWAAYCGDYLARRIISPKKTEDLTEFLGARRKFFVSKGMQKILGKRISFALSHLKKLLG